MLPDLIELHVAGVDDRDFLASAKQQWESVAGFDMSAAMTQARYMDESQLGFLPSLKCKFKFTLHVMAMLPHGEHPPSPYVNAGGSHPSAGYALATLTVVHQHLQRGQN